jgi:hypothetical protein
MKTTPRAMSILILISLAACQLLVPTEPASGYPVEEGKSLSPFVVDWDDRLLFADGLIESQQQILEKLPGASVYHMDLIIEDDLLTITGALEVRYTNQENESLSEVYFRLYPNLFGGNVAITSVQVDGATVSHELLSLNSAMRVPLPGPLTPGDRTVISFDFSIDIPSDMAGNYGLFGSFESVMVLMAFHPVVAAYDDEGWDYEIPAEYGDVSYYDSAFYLVRVGAPARLTLVASGIEVDRFDAGEQQYVTYAAGPIRDFYMAASEYFIVESQTVGETTINSYVFEELGQGAEQSLVYAEGAFESFNTRLAPYPYTEFDMVSTPMEALGMEYPGIVANLDRLYDPNEYVYGAPAWFILESVVAHEAGHQWFYSLVGSNQMDEPWLDEALTQYITGLYYEDTGGPSAYGGYRQSWYDRWDRVDGADIPIGMPVASYTGGEYGAIVYGRGPLFVEALEYEMGEALFDEFLRDYVEIYSWQIATGDDFRQLAEAHCGCDLTDIFEEWVYEK